MKNRGNNVVILVFAIAAVFVILVLVNKGSSIFSVTKYDGEKIIGTESLILKNSIKYSQSTIPLILQAVEPIEEELLLEFKITLNNPFPEESRLRHVIIERNGANIGTELIGKPMQVDETYSYTTEQIDPVGNEAQRNTIKLLFVFESAGEEIVTEYEYNYNLLTKCTDSLDCEAPNNKCDLGNNAGFSTNLNTYCVKPCKNHDQCYEDQICKNGACGY